MLKSPGDLSDNTVELLAHKEDEKRTELLFWSGATWSFTEAPAVPPVMDVCVFRWHLPNIFSPLATSCHLYCFQPLNASPRHIGGVFSHKRSLLCSVFSQSFFVFSHESSVIQTFGERSHSWWAERDGINDGLHRYGVTWGPRRVPWWSSTLGPQWWKAYAWRAGTLVSSRGCTLSKHGGTYLHPYVWIPSFLFVSYWPAATATKSSFRLFVIFSNLVFFQESNPLLFFNAAIGGDAGRRVLFLFLLLNFSFDVFDDQTTQINWVTTSQSELV